MIGRLGLLLSTSLLIGACVAHADPQLQLHEAKLSGSVAESWFDRGATGADYQIEGQYKPFTNHLIYAGAEHLTRAYLDGTTLTDLAYDIGHASKLSQRVYIEDRIAVAPGATFLPLWSATSVPHYIFKNGMDVSLGLRYGHYATDDVGMLSPQWFYPITDLFVISLQLNIVRTWHTIFSEQGYIQYGFDDHRRVRLTGATGRAVEGDNLEGDFTAVALGYKWISRTGFEIEPNASVYRGSVRNETALGVNIGWTFR